MFATRFVAFRFIISNSIPDENEKIIFQNVVIRFNAMNEMIDFRTEFSD